jgi:hypothetical protein
MDESIPLPSERKFGLFFAAILGAFAVWSWRSARPALAGTLLALAAFLLIAALVAPRWLALPNRAWFKVGMALNAVVSPIVLGTMFLLIFVPVALAMRAAGRDALRRRFDAGAATYWNDRVPPGPPPDSFLHQF